MGDGLYVGRYVDPDTLEVGGEPALMKADRLVRHAVCLGMTGSGKTGLCVSLLEELAMAGVPVLVIDPKGDMANLALAFRDLRPQDFEPWVDASAARRKGKNVAEFAADTASMWDAGLTAWDARDRVARFVDRAQVTVFTPGSTAGVPVDVLSALAAPPAALRDDAEALGDLVQGTVSALLGLVGVEADPVSDPSHIVASQILTAAWSAGQDADLEWLIMRLVDPPFKKVGVFPVDDFYPRKDRMKLAMQLNGIVASPAFASWRQGAPLDVDGLLERREGKTPIAVFYTAHLDDAERMFFISTLLEQVVAWSRRQPGTSSLRALLYFDEVFGYLPPHPRNPPTKRAVLTLMKQARAVGLGTMLCTQNPVDVDYKALSNAGTWLIGRLQTDQDRERVLDGLASASGGLDRRTVEGWLEALPSRTFVLRDVKEPEPALVHSRWAISFLRGPLTRREVERLPDRYRTHPLADRAAEPAGVAAPVPAAAPAVVDEGLSVDPPAAPDGYGFRFLDPAVVFSARLAPHFEEAALPRRDDGKVVFHPALLAVLHLRFDEGEFVVDRSEQRLFFPITEQGVADRGDPGLDPGDFLPAAPAGALFAQIPSMVDEASELMRLQKRVTEHLYRGETEKMFRHRELKLTSHAGQTREQFDVQVSEALQDRIDEQVRELRQDIEEDVDRLEARRDKLESDADRWKAEVRGRKANELVSAGETLLSLFSGRRRSLSGNVSKRQQTMRAQEKLTRAEEDISDLEREVYDLQSDLDHKVREIENEWRRKERDVEEVDVRLERDDIRLDEFAVLWVPVTRPI